MNNFELGRQLAKQADMASDALKGTGIGAGIGALAGLPAGLVARWLLRSEKGKDKRSWYGDALKGSLGGALMGAGAGGAIGGGLNAAKALGNYGKDVLKDGINPTLNANFTTGDNTLSVAPELQSVVDASNLETVSPTVSAPVNVAPELQSIKATGVDAPELESASTSVDGGNWLQAFMSLLSNKQGT